MKTPNINRMQYKDGKGYEGFAVRKQVKGVKICAYVSAAKDSVEEARREANELLTAATEILKNPRSFRNGELTKAAEKRLTDRRFTVKRP